MKKIVERIFTRPKIQDNYYTIEFEFELPADLPPSFEMKKSGFQCFVRYSLTAKIFSTLGAERNMSVYETQKKEIRLISPNNRLQSSMQKKSLPQFSIEYGTDKSE